MTSKLSEDRPLLVHSKKTFVLQKKNSLEFQHLVAIRQLVLLLPPSDPLGIGQLLRQYLDVVVGAVRVGRVRVPMLEDGVLPQPDLQLPQQDADDPLVFDGLLDG